MSLIANHPSIHNNTFIAPGEIVRLRNPAHQAYRILHIGFFLLPLIAGFDKFFNLLCVWSRYVPPTIPNSIGMTTNGFLAAVGIVEIIAAIAVLLVPRIGAWIVMAWLWAIIVNLLILHQYYDIALRDFGLSLGALALARLASGRAASTASAHESVGLPR